MKVVFFNYYQSNNRGLETFVQELSQRLPDSKIYYSSKPLIQNRSRINVLQRLFLDLPSLAIGFWTLSQLPTLLKDKPNFIFALNGGLQALILRIFTLFQGSKLIISAQSGPGWDDRFNLFCRPDRFVCLTIAGLEWGRQNAFWPNQKFALIPNGVDLNKFTAKGSRIKTQLKNPIILIVAAAEINKRVEEAIKAVSQLKNISLLWIGKGPLEQKLELIGTKLLGDRFLHMHLPYSDMPKVYRSVNLFTLCSHSSEAFGIAYLEALASNLPIVATNDKTRQEIIGDAGLYLNNPNNIKKYAATLQRALKVSWGNRPQDQAKKFSWDLVAQKYIQLFDELIR